MFKIRTQNPGSQGGWSSHLVEYNVSGNLKRQTAPTEINNVWQPTGDDADWRWTNQEYDWKGRVTREVNPAGIDKLVSYEGCGCAGGLITTIKSALVPRDDQPSYLLTKKVELSKLILPLKVILILII